jgi:2-polyprenyl-3-methyl-5-hydroxy-6-metoxy-1,4-benzoquinol methylase
VDVWARCRNCRSVFRDITPARFQQIHGEAFQDTTHIESALAFAGHRPLRALWELLALPGSSVLEIGPGSGHLLAAARQAGCSVTAVESSKVHREFIRDAWGIGSVYASMEEVPAGRVFDTVVAINVFEHVYDIVAFLRAVRQLLAPGGTCYFSTPNAVSLEATVLRTWWSMCKVHDHVSFPSPAGMATAALESGLRVGRIWSTGLPLEFPVSTLIAARDRALACRGTGRHADRPATKPAEAVRVNAGRKAALANMYSAAALIDPGYRVLGALGRAGSLKATLSR